METSAIHPDLWSKVAAFDRTGRLNVSRVGGTQEKRWEVTIAKEDERVVAEDGSLPRALTAALLAAEARGWPGATA